MSFRPLIHIPKGAVRLILLTVLGGIGLFFIATRTEVGRDLLRSEIEQLFNDQFQGHLSIGVLRGNLVYNFTALDIELRDADGSVIVKIDSAVASPRWSRMLQGHFELGRLHLSGMDASFERSDEGPWNLVRALATRSPRDSTGGTIGSIAIGDLRIADSKLTTANSGDVASLIRNGLIFDYTNAQATIRDIRAIVDWRPTDAQIDLITLSGRIEDRDFDLLEVQGQVVFTDNAFLANQVNVTTPNSQLRLTVSVDNMSHGGAGEESIELALTADPVDHTEFSRILPRSPMRNTTELAARVRGPLSALVIEELAVARRASRIQLEGTAIGLPDSIDFELSVPSATLRRRDLSAVLADPEILRLTDIDSLNFSLLTRGVLRSPFGRPTGKMDLFSKPVATPGALPAEYA